MKRFVEGAVRGQSTLLPECLDGWIDEENPVRVIDAFVDAPCDEHHRHQAADGGDQGVKTSPTSASFHLKELERTGLLIATRQGRFIRYAVHVEAMRRLLTYLTEDCCQGQPELCGSTVKATQTVCTSKGGCK